MNHKASMGSTKEYADSYSKTYHLLLYVVYHQKTGVSVETKRDRLRDRHQMISCRKTQKKKQKNQCRINRIGRQFLSFFALLYEMKNKQRQKQGLRKKWIEI